ncbi:MAG: thioredoxin domain-containing protein [Halanaerobiales bacterium]|nr:thioredoxin domain-containing protein [Halanaerobiales bacterium]
MDTQKKIPNRLFNEKSPYLLQHAYNPVDWYPWGEEAFEKARLEDKPIFLSIGYSTCHWCHVMEEESFEDPEVARLINQFLLPIKVDREERPDIDNIYMNACQIMTGRGGWPLSIFMTADKKPFFTATYIPKKSRYGRMGLLELIPRINELWHKDRDKLNSSANRIVAALQSDETERERGELEEEVLSTAYQEMESGFDDEYGGFGGQPKFPMPHQLVFLLRYWQRSGKQKALEMAEKTLLAMRAGGIYDQLGFAFHRYSTDRQWVLPHFEKMLYDQALLIYAYTEGYQASGKEIFSRTVQEIVAYIEREMTSPQGGFYSAEDADSEGIEGKFYLWDFKEVKELIAGEEKANDFIRFFNLKEKGNYLEEANGELTGKNILHINEQLVLTQLLKYEKIRERLFKEREKRVHPAKDDKILTDWNGLMIAALARAYSVFKQDKFLDLARQGANFIISFLYGRQGLLHRYRDGDAAIKANLDDYAFLIWGFIELYQANYQTEDLEWALKLNQEMIELFWDERKGGFFFAAGNEEELIIRQKEIYDGAIPSGNSVAFWNLVRIAHLTGQHKYQEMALEISRVFSQRIKSSPSIFSQFLLGLTALLDPFYDFVIVGEKDEQETDHFLAEIKKHQLRNKVILLKQQGDQKIASLAKFTTEYKKIDNKTTVYICKDYSCQLPVTTVDRMNEALKSE